MNLGQIVHQLEKLAMREIDPESRRALYLASAELQLKSGHVRPWNEDVRDFQIHFGHFVSWRPTLPDRDVMALRQRLISEEFEELYQALESRDLPEIARESVDLVYVVLGTMESCGLKFQKFWNAVHTANMQKILNPEKNGKTLKPPGWVKPSMAALIPEEVVDLDPLETERARKLFS